MKYIIKFCKWLANGFSRIIPTEDTEQENVSTDASIHIQQEDERVSKYAFIDTFQDAHDSLERKLSKIFFKNHRMFNTEGFLDALESPTANYEVAAILLLLWQSPITLFKTIYRNLSDTNQRKLIFEIVKQINLLNFDQLPYDASQVEEASALLIIREFHLNSYQKGKLQEKLAGKLYSFEEVPIVKTYNNDNITYTKCSSAAPCIIEEEENEDKIAQNSLAICRISSIRNNHPLSDLCWDSQNPQESGVAGGGSESTNDFVETLSENWSHHISSFSS